MKFLNTTLGSWLKVFISAILVQYMAEGADVFSLDLDGLRTLVNAGIAALVPVVINYFNTEDKRYGKTGS